jgi:hypothetical protein
MNELIQMLLRSGPSATRPGGMGGLGGLGGMGGGGMGGMGGSPLGGLGGLGGMGGLGGGSGMNGLSQILDLLRFFGLGQGGNQDRTNPRRGSINMGYQQDSRRPSRFNRV